MCMYVKVTKAMLNVAILSQRKYCCTVSNCQRLFFCDLSMSLGGALKETGGKTEGFTQRVKDRHCSSEQYDPNLVFGLHKINLSEHPPPSHETVRL